MSIWVTYPKSRGGRHTTRHISKWEEVRDVIIITLIDNTRGVIIITLIDNTRDVIIITLIDNTNMIESKLYTTSHFMVPCKVRFFLFKCTIESEIQDGRHHRIFF